MHKYFWAVLAAVSLFIACWFWGETIWVFCRHGLEVLTDQQRITIFIKSFGMLAPAVFVSFQVLQVIFAPFPGEVSGFVGGYLFGAFKGFIWSTIGLTMGSWINFLIGRFFGRPFIIRHIPGIQRRRFESLLNGECYWLLFILFIFPGFPKDYLCLFLGLSTIPIKVFLLLSTVGRMPGTLLLSLQGACLLEGRYTAFLILAALCLVLTGLAYRYRNVIFQWIEK
jgi:uncharacterized membrane protein YdjX (TVP38/TMEM64 family)